MKSIVKVSALACIALLSACSTLKNSRYFHNKYNAYRQARNYPVLHVPKHLSDAKLNNYFVIPPRAGQVGVSLQPPVKG